MAKLILGYWNIRGLAQPIRFVMEYAGLDWKDKLYIQAGADAIVPFDKSSWFDVKDSIGLRYPNLPYLVDESNGLKLTESRAILYYVAKKRPELNLLGVNAEDAAKCDEAVSYCADQKGRMTGLQYREGRCQEFLTHELPLTLATFERNLAANGDGEWFVGDAPTVADFVIWEYVDVAVLYAGGEDTYLSVQNCPKLAAFKKRFETLPTIHGYLQSERFKTHISGINNQHAKFR